MKNNMYETPVAIAIAIQSKDVITLSNGINQTQIDMSVGIEEL
jgi:hypothetical protein